MFTFSIEDIEYLKFVISISSVAIERSILFKRVSKFSEELQKEVEEHLNQANDLYDDPPKLEQNSTEKDLPEIEKIVMQTKLSSIYKG